MKKLLLLLATTFALAGCGAEEKFVGYITAEKDDNILVSNEKGKAQWYDTGTVSFAGIGDYVEIHGTVLEDSKQPKMEYIGLQGLDEYVPDDAKYSFKMAILLAIEESNFEYPVIESMDYKDSAWKFELSDAESGDKVKVEFAE